MVRACPTACVPCRQPEFAGHRLHCAVFACQQLPGACSGAFSSFAMLRLTYAGHLNKLRPSADLQERCRFFTYNYLNAWLPKYEDDLPKRLLRSAFIGFSASFVSDTRRVHPSFPCMT